jgi:cytidylate kinase
MSLMQHVIGLSGPRGSGKSTIAQHLVDEHGFERLAFSDVLREIANLAGPEQCNDRRYLSELGRLLRGYQPDFLLTIMKIKLERSSSRVVIEDIRFPEELRFCQLNGILTVCLDVTQTEQLRRIIKREQCSLQEAEELANMADNQHLNRFAKWDHVLFSEGDFKKLALSLSSLVALEETEVGFYVE